MFGSSYTWNLSSARALWNSFATRHRWSFKLVKQAVRQEAQPSQEVNHNNAACKEQQTSPCSPKACQRASLFEFPLLPLYTYTIAHTHREDEQLHGKKTTHMLKLNQTMLLLPAGKGGLECFLFSLFITHTANTGIPIKNLYRKGKAV